MNQTGINNFSGKRIWIVGASSGIGEACAQSLLLTGAKVALSGRRVERLIEIAKIAGANQSLIIPVDVTNPLEIIEAHKSILDSWGGIDLLLFVSGAYIPMRANDLTIEAA